MATKTSNSYAYQPLKGKHEARLISLLPSSQPTDPVHCDVIHIDLSVSFPDYEAVSYTWLTEKDLTCGLYYEHITLANCPNFPVTPNCHSALKRFRQPFSPRLLWLDAICIDQSNVTERSQQVLLMGHIFQSAIRVLIWLGDAEPSDQDALQEIRNMHEFFNASELNQRLLDRGGLWEGRYQSGVQLPDPEDQVWVGICNFLWRRWFSRAWIIQEVAMARKAVIYCGQMTLSWEILANVTRQLSVHGLLFYLRSTRKGGRPMLPSVDSIDRIKTEVLSGSRQLKLVDTLFFSQWFQVTDPRDRIYSLLNFVADDEQITPDYTISPADLYSQVVADAMTKAKSLDLLENVQGLPPIHNSDIPSWVGTWGLKRVTLSKLTTLSETSVLKEPEFRFTEDRRTLIVRGRIIDSIKDLAPEFTHVTMDGRYSYKAARFKLAWDTVQWILAIEMIAKGDHKYLDGNIEETVARVLCLDSMTAEQKATRATYSQFYRDWKDFHRLVMSHFEAGGGTFDGSKALVQHQEKVEHYIAAVADAANYRQFCSTKIGRLGLVPTMSQVDDVICILRGCRTPFVLRPGDSSQSFQFVGECYIDGLMDAEALQTLPTPKRSFWARHAKRKSEADASTDQDIFLT